MNTPEFVRCLRNDLKYFEGVSDAVCSPAMRRQVESTRNTLNTYLMAQGLDKNGFTKVYEDKGQSNESCD